MTEERLKQKVTMLDSLNAPEPAPNHNDSRPIWELVIEDMRARDNAGRQKYGTPLQANNGRNPLVDAYQESLDFCVYLRQAIEEHAQTQSPNGKPATQECPLRKALEDLYCQVNISGAVDPYGNALKNLKAMRGARAALAAPCQREEAAFWREYGWRPISEAHEDWGTVVLINAADPGDVRLGHVCMLNPDWDEVSEGMTHFARVPAFESRPEAAGPEVRGEDQ